MVRHSEIYAVSSKPDYQAFTTSCVAYGASTLPLFGASELSTGERMPQTKEGMIPYPEVQKHNSAHDCWVIINVS